MEGAFKGLWITGATVLSAGQISPIMRACWTTLKTKSSCRSVRPLLHPPLLLSLLMHVLSELEAFPELYAERGRIIAEEERNARLDTPLFVCQLSFPGVPTTLHFFEPR